MNTERLHVLHGRQPQHLAKTPVELRRGSPCDFRQSPNGDFVHEGSFKEFDDALEFLKAGTLVFRRVDPTHKTREAHDVALQIAQRRFTGGNPMGNPVNLRHQPDFVPEGFARLQDAAVVGFVSLSQGVWEKVRRPFSDQILFVAEIVEGEMEGVREHVTALGVFGKEGSVRNGFHQIQGFPKPGIPAEKPFLEFSGGERRREHFDPAVLQEAQREGAHENTKDRAGTASGRPVIANQPSF